MSIAEIRHLYKEYPTFKLCDVTFDLNKGQITGFIGRNGAGKTTTIKSMLNLVHPASGEITYFGLPLCGNEAEIKKRIGYSTGAVNYYPRKKLKDIVSVTKSFYPDWDDTAYHEYLTLFRLDESKSPSEFSDGMRVKCNLLMALSHRAELLILDEPTSGLDPFSREEILEIFIMLKKLGVAILFSTHITSDLEKCADNIIYIREGSIVAKSSMGAFSRDFGRGNETLEEIMLRLEKEARYE